MAIEFGIALISTLLNLFIVEPANTSVMFKRYALEDKGEQQSDAYKKLASKFGQLHGISSILNLGATITAFTYAWRLALRLTL